MSGNHGEDDRAKPKSHAEAHQEQIQNLEQESLQHVEGNELRFPFDDENNERSDPQTHDLQHVGENGHCPLVERWFNRRWFNRCWLYRGWTGCAGLHCFNHAFARATRILRIQTQPSLSTTAAQSPVAGFRSCPRRWCTASRRGKTFPRDSL